MQMSSQLDNQRRGVLGQCASSTQGCAMNGSGAGFGVGPDRRQIASRALVAASALAALLLVANGSAFADEVQVSTTKMEDFEFDRTDALLQFVDVNNNLWVGSVDTTTGDFVPSSGEGILVDTNAAKATTFGNGPEWVESSSGYSIVYNKYQPGTAGTQAATNAFLALASLTGNGSWQVSNLPNTQGLVDEEGNINPTQSDPPVIAANGIASGNPPLSMEGIDDAEPVTVPNTNFSIGTYRFVNGMNALVYSEPVSGSTISNRQVFMYDLDTGTTTQLTTDAGNKEFVIMYQAPEFDNAYVLCVQVNDTSTQLYRQMTPGSSAWTAFQTITTPPGAPNFNYKPTPFVYNNKSYIFMERSTVANPENFSVPNQIWVASMDGTINQQVSDPTLSEVRDDPKWYATAQGVFIYYNVYTPATSTTPTIPQGVWRSNSTIPLAAANKSGGGN
jgi:hypothetical protein